jgi:hypothetical protein
MTGLDWKSKFTSAVIRPYFEGTGASPERHLRGKLSNLLLTLAANQVLGRQEGERANGVPSLRRSVRC